MTVSLMLFLRLLQLDQPIAGAAPRPLSVAFAVPATVRPSSASAAVASRRRREVRAPRPARVTVNSTAGSAGALVCGATLQPPLWLAARADVSSPGSGCRVSGFEAVAAASGLAVEGMLASFF